MAPSRKKRRVATGRPLASPNKTTCDQDQIEGHLREIFNNSQHVTTSDQALNQLKGLYTKSHFVDFEKPFMNCLKTMLQQKQSIYFKTTCDFACKFLEHVAINLQDERLVRSCCDVADHYMQLADEDCRHNAVVFTNKILLRIESLDEEICNALKVTIPKRIRDKKPTIRAQAVLASRKFQDNKMIQDAFRFHFTHDPDIAVRKALVQTMDVAIFGPDFLAESTQDSHESIRKLAYVRLAKISPDDLSLDQIHQIMHNGLFEREHHASFSFKTNTLDPWLSKMYDGSDLVKLLEYFDVVKHPDDVAKLLSLVHERDLDKIENNGTATKLHHVVEEFRERWLASNNKCLPNVDGIDEKIVTVWLSLLNFCKKYSARIKPVKVKIQPATSNPNQSIERILDSQEQSDEEVVDLYERLLPDLVNLAEFLKRLVKHIDRVLKEDDSSGEKLEFVYAKLMGFMSTYEIGDDLERKTVQEVLSLLLKGNLLTGTFEEFIPSIVKCLKKLVYSTSPNLLINYISEHIQNMRSHLEDLAAPNQPLHSVINIPGKTPGKTPKSARKVRISEKLPARVSMATEQDEQNLEFEIATKRVDLHELQDKLDECIKTKDFDQAKSINSQIEDLQAKLNLLNGRRRSIASDLSNISFDFDDLPAEDKLQSTMLGTPVLDASVDESHEDSRPVFKHHANELIMCLQMYLACLESVSITEVPDIMKNHLKSLTFESLHECFRTSTRIRGLMVACNGMTALLDKSYAQEEATTLVLVGSCFDPTNSLNVKTIGFKSLVDVMIEHNEVNIDKSKLERFLISNLKEYGKYDPKDVKKDELECLKSLIIGTTKLFYYRKLESPEILSHIILWWYHPRTHSWIKQFIGLFLPKFIGDIRSSKVSNEDNWLEDLLANTFATSIEYLCDYILGPGQKIMAQGDMLNLISFLCYLVPISFHPRVHDAVDKKIDDLDEISCAELIKFLKQSKNSLAAAEATFLAQSMRADESAISARDPVIEPLRLFD